MKRSKPLRRRTPKRAALDREANKWRQAYVLELGSCELCGTTDLSILALHEIVRTSLRKYVYTNPTLTLCLCNAGQDCHTVVAGWKPAKQLALVKFRRPGDLDLVQYNRWATARLTLEDILAAENELLSELTHESY